MKRLFPASPPGRPKSTNSIGNNGRYKSPRSANKTRAFESDHAKSNNNSQAVDTGGMIIFECTIKKKDRCMNFIVREFPISANFFSLDICVTKTQQQWCVFVPVVGDLGELLRMWKIAPIYENKRELGEWLLRATKIEFKKDVIVGADFNQSTLQTKCRHELIKLIYVMAVKIQSAYRMHLVYRHTGRLNKKVISPEGAQKRNGRRVRKCRSPGRKAKRTKTPRALSPTSMANHLRDVTDVSAFRTLHFANLPRDSEWEEDVGEYTARHSKSAGVSVHHRPHPPQQREKKSTTPRHDRIHYRQDERIEKLALMASAYLPPRERSPSPAKSLVLSELRQLRNDMAGALNIFETELEMLREDFGRSIVSDNFATSHSLDNVDSVITGDLESPSTNEREKLRGELAHMQAEMSRMQLDLKKQREMNLITRKFDVNAADPVQWSAWICIQQNLLRFVRRRKFARRLTFLLEKIGVISDELLIREALMKSRLSGSIQLAAHTLRRIYTIVMSHSQQDNAIISNYVPTNPHDLQLIYDTLFDFLSVSSVLRTGLDVTVLLLAISNIEDMANMVGTAGACQLLISAMKRHSRDDYISAAVVKVCSRIFHSSPENRLRLLTKHFFENLRLLFVRNSREPDAVEKIGKFICKIYGEDDAVRAAYLEHNYYQAMVECIREYMSSDLECLFMICKTIINLCSHRSENCRTVFSLPQNFDVYVDCLEANRTHEKCFKQIAVMMVCIIGKQNDMMEYVRHSRLVPVLMSSLKVSDSSMEEIVKSTVTLVYNFAGHESVRSLFLSEGMDGVLAELANLPFSKGTITGIGQTRHRLAHPLLDLAAYKLSGAKNIEDRLRRSEMVARIRRNISQTSITTEGSPMESDGIKTKVDAEINVLLTLIDDSDDVEIVLHCLRQAVENSSFPLATKAMRRLDILVTVTKKGHKESDMALLPTLLAEHMLMFDVMANFSESEDIQYNGLKVLLQLPYSRRDFKLFGSDGVCRLVSNILSRHHADDNTLATCVAYANLLTSAEYGTKESRAKLGNEQVVGSICKAMTCHVDNLEIMTRIGQLLRNLSINSVENQVALGSGGVCELLMAFLIKHKQDESVIGMCTRSILSLCANSCQYNRLKFGTAANFGVFVEIIATNLSTWKICKQMCMVIVDILGKGEAGLGNELLHSGICPRICRIIEGLVGAHSPDDDMIQSLLMLVACFVYNVEEVRPILVRANLVVTMKAILDGHYGYNIVKLAKVITNYLRKSNNLSEMSSTDIVPAPEGAPMEVKNEKVDKRDKAAAALTKGLKAHLQNKALHAAQERALELIDIIGRVRDITTLLEALEVSVAAGSMLLATKAMRRVHALLEFNLTASRADVVPINSALLENPYLLINTMSHFLSDAKIQSTGLAILQQLSREKEDIELMGALGMCELLGNILGRHVDNDDITSLSLSYAHVLTSVETGTYDNRERASAEKVAGSIISVLRIHIDDADIVAKCFQLIRDVCTDSPANQDNLGLAGAGERIMSYMSKNQGDELAVSVCSHTILSLCSSGGKMNRDRLASFGAITFYMGIIKNNIAIPRVCKQVCMLLVGLSEQNRDYISDSFFGGKVVETLQSLLDSSLPPATAQALIMLTVHIIISMPMHRSELMSVGMVDTLLKYTGGGFIEAIRKAASTGIRKLIGDTKPPSVGAIVDVSQTSLSVETVPVTTVVNDDPPSEYQVLAAHTITRNIIARKEAIAQKQRLITLLQVVVTTQNIDIIIECLCVSVVLGSVDLALKVMQRIDAITHSTEASSELRPALMQVLISSSHLLLDVMSSFVSLAEIQLIGLRTLDRLPLAPDDVNRFGIAGCCNMITDVIARHVTDATICSTAVLLGIRLTVDSEANRLRIPARRCCTALCCCIAAHTNNVSLVDQCFQFVRVLSFGSVDIADMMGICGMCDKVVSRIGSNKSDESVIESCVETLAVLCGDTSSLNRGLVATRDFFRQCMAVIRANPTNPKLCRQMCKLLVDFSSDGEGRVADELVYSGLAGDLVAELGADSTRRSSADVIECLIMLTVHNALRVPVMAAELASVGGIEVLKWHRENTPDEKMQRVVSAGIQKLSSVSPSMKNEAARIITRQLYAACAKNAVRSKLRQHLSDIDNCASYDTIVHCLRACVELGSLALALKTVQQLHTIVSSFEVGQVELRGALIGAICSSPLLLLNVMSSFVSVRDIPLLGLQICDRISMNYQDIELFGVCGGCHVVVDILGRHGNDSEICFANLTFAVLLVESNVNNLQRLPSRKCCNALCSIIATHSRNLPLIEECFSFVRFMCAKSKEIADMMGKCGMCDKVLTHIRANQTDETVIESSLKSISVLTTDKNSPNCRSMASRAALNQYMAVIRANPTNPKICKHMCKLLVDISGDGEGPVGDELVFSGLAADLVHALNEDNVRESSPDVIQALIMLAVHFAVNVPILRSELTSVGMVTCFRRFQESDMSEAVCKVCALGIRKLKPRVLQQSLSMPIYDIFGIDRKDESRFEGVESNSDDDFCAEDIPARGLLHSKSRVSDDEEINKMFEHLDASAAEDFVLECLKKATANSVVDLAIRALWRVHFLVDSQIDRKIILNPNVITETLFKFSDNAEIQALGAGVLLRLPKHPGNAEKFGILGTLDIIAENFLIHVADADICEVSLNLALQLTSLSVHNRRTFPNTNIATHLPDVMHKHCDNKDIVALICRFIRSTCRDSPHCQTCLGDAGVTDVLLQQIASDPCNEPLVVMRANALIALCSDNISNRRIAVADGRIKMLASTMRLNADSVKICKELCKLVVEICGKGEPSVGDALIESGIAELLLDLLKVDNVKTTKSQNVQAILMLVVYLIINVTCLGPSFIAIGTIDTLRRFALVVDDELKKAIRMGIQKLEPKVLERASSFQNKWKPQFSVIGSLLAGGSSGSLFRLASSEAASSTIQRCVRRFLSRKALRDKVKQMTAHIDSIYLVKEIQRYIDISIASGSRDLAVVTARRYQHLVSMPPASPTVEGESEQLVSKTFRSKPKPLLDLATAFLSIRDIQVIVITELLSFSVSEVDANRLGSVGACNVIFHILRRHSSDVHISTLLIQYGIKLASLCADNRSKLCRAKCCDVLHGSMSAHVENADYMENCFKFICTLCNDMPSNQENIGNAAIGSIMLKHLTVTTATESSKIACVRAISAVCANDDPGNRVIFSTKTSLGLVIKTCTSHPQSLALCKEAGKLLTDLIGKGDNSLDGDICESGIAVALKTALSEEKEATTPVAVTEMLTILVLQLVVNVPALRLEFVNVGMIETLQRYSAKTTKDSIKKFCVIGIRKLTSVSATHKDEAARTITGKLSILGSRLAMKTQLQNCLSVVDETISSDEMMQSIRTSVHMGSVELASKSMKRVAQIIEGDDATLCDTRLSLLSVLREEADVIIAVMSSFISIGDIQSCGLAILSRSCGSVSDKERFGAAGACAQIASILHRHMTDRSLCAAAVSTALDLVAESVRNAILFAPEKSCAVLQETMKSHVDSKELMMDMLQLVLIISNSGSEGQNNLGKVGMCSSVVKYLILHMTNESVVSIAFAIITCMCARNHEANRATLSSPKYLRFYLRVVKLNPHHRSICNQGCKLLIDLIESGDEAVFAAIPESGISADLVTALSEENVQKYDSEVIQILIMTVVHFAVNVSAMRTDLAGNGMVDTLQRFVDGTDSDVIKKAAQIGIKKLKQATPSARNDAARTITRQLSKVGPNKAAKTRLEHCLDIVADCTDCAEIMSCMATSVEMGNVKLATATMKRIKAVIVSTDNDNKTLREAIKAAISDQPDSLFRAMTAFMSISEVQISGLAILGEIPLSLPEKEKFGTAGVHMLLSLIIHRHMTSETICASAVAIALDFVSDSASNAALFSYVKCCTVIQKVMTMYIESEILMVDFLQLVCCISGSGVEARDQLGRVGMCGLVVNILISNINLEAIVVTCLSTISSLCTDGHEMNRSVLASEKYLRLYLHAACSNPTNSKICNRVCQLLIELCGTGDGPMGKELVKSGLASDIVSGLSSSNEQHMNPDVLQGLVVLAVHIAINIPAMRIEFANAGFLDTLKRFVGDSYSPSIEKAAQIGIRKITETVNARNDAARTITRQLSKVGPNKAAKTRLEHCLDIVADCTDCAEIMSCMATSVEMGNVKLATATMKRINDVILSTEIDKRELGDSVREMLCTDPSALLDLMSSFISIGDIQIYGLSILHHCPRSVLDKERLGIADGHKIICVVLHRHLSNEALCAAAVSAGLELVTDCASNAALFAHAKCLAMLQKVMVKYKESDFLVLSLLQLMCFAGKSGAVGKDSMLNAGIVDTLGGLLAVGPRRDVEEAARAVLTILDPSHPSANYEVEISSDEFSRALVRASSGKDVTLVNATLSRVAAILDGLPEELASLEPLAASPAPILDALLVFGSDVKIVGKILNVVHKLSKMAVCDRKVLANRKYFSCLVHIFSMHPTATKVCKRLCILLVDLGGSGDGYVGQELVKSKIASDLETLLDEEHEKLIAPDIIQAVIMLVVHFAVNVPVMRSALQSAGMLNTLTRYNAGNYGERVSQATLLGIRKLSE